MKRYVAATIAAIVAILVLCGNSPAQSRIYLADEADHELYWTFTNGTNQTVFSTTTPVSLEIDQHNGWAYWLTANYGHGQFGRLHRARLDNPSQHEVILESGYTEGGLQIDPTTGFAYWAAPAVVEGPPWFSIVRSATNGSSQEVWLPAVSDDVNGMDLDPSARLLFWTAGNELMRAHLDVKNAGPLSLDWGTMQERPFNGGVAVDPAYRKVYWAEGGTPYGPLNGETSRIFRAQYSGGPVTLVYEGNDAKVTDMAFDPVTRTLYWLERFLENNVEKLAIRKAPVGNPLPLSGTEVMRPDRMPRDFALFADPGAATLTSPTETETVETTVELSWLPVLGSFRYDVQVASDSAFESILFSENTPSTTSTFVAPVAERNYFWRIKSNACNIAPHWSDVRTLKFGDSGPLAARLTHPAVGGKVEPEDVFTWDAAPAALTYSFQIAPHDDFGNVLVHGSELTNTSFEVSGLERGETYFWRVAGFDDTGRYTFTKPQAFSVATLLTAVSLSKPADGSRDVEQPVVFEWMPLDGAATYELEIGGDPDFANVLKSVTAENTSYTVDVPFSDKTTFYWRVRAVNQSGPGDWSSVWQFTTAAAEVLAAVTLSEPSDRSEGVMAYTDFQWISLDGAESYEIEVSSNPDFTELAVSATTAENAFAVETPLGYETKYYWRVRGINDVGPGEWSETWSFTTAVGTANESLADIPIKTELLQPYPNPTAASVEVPFIVAEQTDVKLTVFSVDGRLVASVDYGRLTAGRYVKRLDTARWPAGSYTVIMEGHGRMQRSVTVVH